MTKREEFEKAIRTLRKMQNEQFQEGICKFGMALLITQTYIKSGVIIAGVLHQNGARPK